MIASGIQPLQNLRVIFKFPEEERSPWCKAAIEHGFQGQLKKLLSITFVPSNLFSAIFFLSGLTAIEKLLDTNAGEYCVGDQVTFADCCLVPQVYNGRMYVLKFFISRIPILQ